MMNRQVWLTVWAAAGLALGMGASVARGDELARWNSTGADGSSASFGPVYFAEGVSVTNLTRGSGLNASSGSGTYQANGYNATSFDAAMSGGDYWETCLNPQGGLMSLETLTYWFGGSKTGPSSWQWAAKIGASGAWTPLGSPVTWARTDTRYDSFTVDLGEVAVSDQPVWFRLVAWGASGTSGSGNFGKATDVLVFEGSVQSADGPPVVRFTPSAGAVDFGKTLEMAVSLLPSESGVKAWSFEPKPAGTFGLEGGVFTFTPTAADVLKRFTLSVTATNANGTTTEEASVFVNEAAPEGTLTLTFDNDRQTTWTGAANVEIPAGSGNTWSMKYCMIGEDGSDRVYSGAGRSLRFAYDESGEFTSKVKIVSWSKESDTVHTNGVKAISFWYGIYPEDTGEESEHSVRPVLVTELSDDGKLWVEVDRVSTEGSEEKMVKREVTVGVETPVYFRIRTEGVSGSSRVNVDQIRVEPKVTDKDQRLLWLLQHNVTPGDKLTGYSEDWDGDGLNNQMEYIKKKDPYDRNSK